MRARLQQRIAALEAQIVGPDRSTEQAAIRERLDAKLVDLIARYTDAELPAAASPIEQVAWLASRDLAAAEQQFRVQVAAAMQRRSG